MKVFDLLIKIFSIRALTCAMAFALASLTSVASASIVPADRHGQKPIRKPSQQLIVYVSDFNTKKVYEYPAGVQNPKQLLSFATTDTPRAIAVDLTGRVYVTYYGASANGVDIFTSGGQLIANIDGSVIGFRLPRGINFDSSGNMYLGVINTMTGRGGYYVFPPGAVTPNAFVPEPSEATAFVAGVALDPQNNLYLGVDYPYLRVYEYPLGHTGSPIEIITSSNAYFGNGMTVLLNGDVTLAAAAQKGGGELSFYAPPSYALTSEITTTINGQEVSAYSPYVAPNGTLYVPASNAGASPGIGGVIVLPLAPSQQNSYTIATDLTSPIGVAVGPAQ